MTSRLPTKRSSLLMESTVSVQMNPSARTNMVWIGFARRSQISVVPALWFLPCAQRLVVHAIKNALISLDVKHEMPLQTLWEMLTRYQK